VNFSVSPCGGRQCHASGAAHGIALGGITSWRASPYSSKRLPVKVKVRGVSTGPCAPHPSSSPAPTEPPSIRVLRTGGLLVTEGATSPPQVIASKWLPANNDNSTEDVRRLLVQLCAGNPPKEECLDRPGHRPPQARVSAAAAKRLSCPSMSDAPSVFLRATTAGRKPRRGSRTPGGPVRGARHLQ
jgi:hypothetical protein